MKGNLKQRIIAFILCITMILTSINILNLFENIFSAATESWDFSYTGNIQKFTAPYSGKYKLETWGAQGGSSATAGGLGGYGYVEVILLEGETLYIVCGGKGVTAGVGGYNGGGSSTLGGSGGGATHIAFESGLLSELSNKKDSLLCISGGGGGSYQAVLPNQPSWLSNKDSNGNTIITNIITDAFTLPGGGGGSQGSETGCTAENYNCTAAIRLEAGNQTSGYAFGQGESGVTGAGGGLYGGYAGNKYYLSSSGGSGYVIETEFSSETKNNINYGDGKAKISYLGKASRTITIDTKGCGTYDEQQGKVTINVNSGDEITLKELKLNEGYIFHGYVDSNGNLIKNTFIMGKKNMELKASFYAPLIINKEKDSINTIKIHMTQNDDYEKYYKVLQSTNGSTWYDAALSADAINGTPTKNREYNTGSYKYTVPFTGSYKIRLYGAQGGNALSQWGTGIGGKGSYTEGIITLTKGTVLYINIGTQGNNQSVQAYGGSHASGGHASDIRISNNAIANRIMVAAGGGGGSTYVGYVMNGLPGGTLTSQGTSTVIMSGGCWAGGVTGATQTSGSSFQYNATGHGGGSGTSYSSQSGPAQTGGGYGYWCGNAVGSCDNVSAGTGGSSYISGFSGCATYSGYVFTNTKMTGGIRSGNGYGYIDLLDDTTVYGTYMNGITFYDTKAPNKPSNYLLNKSNNVITISWKDNGDNGDKYYHKVESYNKETDELINTSNILEDYLETGVIGYRYYADTKATGTVTINNSTFVEENFTSIASESKYTYFHVAAVDGAGNISETYSFEIPSLANYTVNHYIMDLNGEKYELKETENLASEVNTEISPKVKNYEGFTSPSTQTVKIAADGTTVVNYYYTRNSYPVTYIDVVDSINGKQLGKSTDKLPYETTATGATKGTDTADNKYYNGYYYSSCTTETVGTNGATVYRIFKLRTLDINGSVNWNDKSNAYSSRQENVTITLFRNGTKIDTVTGLTDKDNNTFSFKGLPKYDTTTGETYVYTVSQSDVVSNNNPEEKYTTNVDSTGFNFTNTLTNSTKEDPEPEWVGFDVNGSIIWEDYEDKFGTRPNEVTIRLYQNGVLHKTQVVDKNATGYSFVNLDKYDNELNPYTYKVEETFTSKVLTWNTITKQYEEIDAYTITVDGFDFTNTLVDTYEKPIIPVKPDHINTLTFKLDFNDDINWSDIKKNSSEVTSFVTLKQMGMIMNDGTVSYTSNYNGMEYKAIVNESGITINNIPSGKYEIVESNDNTFVLEGIDLQTTNSMSVANENGKWYLIIAETNQNQTGTISLIMNADSFNGIDNSATINNLYSLENTSTAQVMMLSMFSDEVTVPEYIEPITYTITYKDCDVVDDTKYSENCEAALKDCEIEGFLGWSEDSEAVEPQYMAGDKVKLEKDLILYPVIETPESTEENSSEETTEEIESEEQEETTETEEEVISEEESSEEHEESSEIEETTESEEIESSAFSE